MLLAKHKTPASKLQPSELMKKILAKRPATATSAISPVDIRFAEKKTVAKKDCRIGLGKSNSVDVLESFVLGSEIGKGAYATVRSARDLSNNQFAVKIYDKIQLLKPSRKQNAEREIKILAKLDHPNIVKLVKTVENQNSLNLVLEYIPGSSLMSYLKQRPKKRMDEAEAKSVFRQIMLALDYCHSQGIAHRDIKLENILIDSTNSVKLIDFGFSTCLAKDRKAKIFCGTPSYMAPEIVKGQESFGPPSDIWAAGVVLYMLLVGQFPFRGINTRDLYNKIKLGSFTTPCFVSREATQLIQSMLRPDPAHRPSASEILAHVWIGECFSLSGGSQHSISAAQIRVSLNSTFEKPKSFNLR
jgi:serine/threonine protein kinase